MYDAVYRVIEPSLWFFGIWSLRWAVVISFTWALLTLLSPQSAMVRRSVCLTTFVVGLVLPLLPSWQVAIWPAVRQPLTVSDAAAEMPSRPADDTTAAQAWPQGGSKFGELPEVTLVGDVVLSQPRLQARSWILLLIAAVWCIGIAVGIARLLYGLVALRRLLRESNLLTGPMAEMLASCSTTIGLKRQVRLAVHHAISSPVAVGLTRPTILVPENWRNVQFDTKRAVLFHELQHLKNCDDWWLLASALIATSFFYHPLVGWLLRRTAYESELACDDAAIRAGISTRAYTRALLFFAQRTNELSDRWLSGRLFAISFGRKRTMKTRIIRLIDSGYTCSASPTSRWLPLCVGCFLAGVVSGTFTLTATEQQAAPTTAKDAGEDAKNRDSEKLPPKQLAASDQEKQAKNLPQPTHVRGIETGSRHAEAIAFTSDGKYMVSGGFDCHPPESHNSWAEGKADGILKMSNVETGKVMATFHGTAGAIIDVAISPENHLIATAGRVRNDPRLGEVSLWDMSSGQQTLTLQGHTNWVLSVAFSPDGKWLASGGFDKVARIWEVTSGKLVTQLPEQEGIIDVVAFSADGSRLATATRRGVVTLWDAATWQRSGGFSKERYFLLDLAFSPDGKWLATGGETYRQTDSGADEWNQCLILLYPLETEDAAKEIAIDGKLATSISFSPDSSLLAALSMPKSGSMPGGIVVCDVEDQSVLTVIRKGRYSSADQLQFLPTGRTVAATDIRGTVSFWNLAER